MPILKSKAQDRAEYEKKYAEYVKQKRVQDSQKIKDKVVEGTGKVAKDYIVPTAKTVGAFTPVGPAIGLTDAYSSYKKGDSTGAIVGAGLEALPYIAKGTIKGAGRLLNKSRRNTAISEYIAPFGYSYKEKLPEIKDFVLNYVIKGEDIPKEPWTTYKSVKEPFRTDMRMQAWRKYLQVPKETDNLYIPNNDGTFRYNPELIPTANVERQRELFRTVGNGKATKEILTAENVPNAIERPGNAGGLISKIDDQGNFIIKDDFDLMPLQQFPKLPRRVRDFEVGKLVGGKPFTVKDELIGKITKQ